LLYLAILATLIILSSFIVVHSYAQESEVKYLLRVTSSPNIIYLDGTGSYAAGTSVTLEAPEAWRDYKFEGWQIDGRWSFENPLTISMNRSHNVEAVYTKTGSVGEIIVDAIPRVTEITVDGTIYLPSELPLSFDWDDGSQHTIIVSDGVRETINTQYKFDSWKDRNTQLFRTVTVNQDTQNYVALYKTQHYFKPITELGTILGGGWHDEGSTVTFELESDIILDKKNENIRYVFDSWDKGDYPNSATNMIDVLEPVSVKANWNEQYKLELKSNVPEYNLFGTGWYDKERQVALIAEDELESPNLDTRFVFDRWASKGPNPVIIPNTHLASTTITMAEPFVIEAQYKKSYLVAVWTPYASSIGGGYYPAGEIAEITISQKDIIIDPNKVRKIFKDWDLQGARVMDFTEESKNLSMEGLPGVQNLFVIVDKPTNVTANWKTQYYLNVISTEGTVEGGGWYDIGSYVSIKAKIPSTPAGMWTTLTFEKWTGDINSSKERDKVLINRPKTVIAEWKEDKTPGIINGIVLAGIAGVGMLVYVKTRNGKLPFLNGKKSPNSSYEAGFDKFLNTRSSKYEPEQKNSKFVIKQSRMNSIFDWLLGRGN